MSAAASNRPIIIKRKKVSGGDGHHGGAWKVAYADFVTAMMAFFMLMWLLNATTEQQRKGIADYFAPTIPINRVSGGGDGAFEGTLRLLADEGVLDGIGGADGPDVPVPIGAGATADEAAAVAALREIERMLVGAGGESLVSDRALRHVVTRLTDEGLVIEVYSLPGEPIFAPGTAEPTDPTREVLGMVARVARLVTNPVRIESHLATRPVTLADNPVWDLSHDRAEEARLQLEAGGIATARIEQVAASADREPVTDDPSEPRNERLQIILAR
ncbi:flagellar motor protein MotB [Wenxinia saemankumensis]|uniref:Chemotaxis protein MotB n=1 Tax=Wenxinia saemankumensis TaxID=1447782 RepID=A0A1M6FQG0_9RHOB|nr:flagellar motor protein MotB [Wenxinia saemankumensis]SHI99978.1 chemotaxis protein MotB [Wenxinia saemankumensis]